MDKEEVVKRLKELNLPKDEYYVLSGASLVLRGIREQCSDIDLCISEELFEKIKNKLKMTSDKLNECGFYHLSDSLEIVVDKKSRFNMEEGEELREVWAKNGRESLSPWHQYRTFIHKPKTTF